MNYEISQNDSHLKMCDLGLDAAGPLFRRSHLREKSKKLDWEDADFVDVLHTDSSPVTLKLQYHIKTYYASVVIIP